MKKIIIGSIILIIGYLSACSTMINNDKQLITLGKPEILEEHNLELPTGAISINVGKIFEMEGKPFLFAYFYPICSLYIYDLTEDSIYSKIKLGNSLISINDVEFYNKDSIMIYGHSDNFENDSNIRCINIKGDIKHVYPLIHPSIISSKNPAKNLISSKSEIYPSARLLFDNKIFVTFDYSYYNIKGCQKKYPLVGYYDLLKDSLVINHDIWYPEINNNCFYKQSVYYQFFTNLNDEGNIVISFAYTPTLIEWDYKKNKIQEYRVDSKFMSSIPFSNSETNKDSDNINNFENGLYSPGISSVMNNQQKIYFRCVILPKKYGKRKVLRVFFDSKYQYLGEMLIDDNIYYETYKGKYYSCDIENNKLNLKFIKPTFIPFEENKLKIKLDSIEKIEIARKNKKKNELCEIAGNNRDLFTYQKNDIIKYLFKTQQIQDTSFSVAIINKSGCGSCNEYVLQFLKYNQATLFNLKSRPMYLLYVSENGTIEDIENYLGNYILFDNKHVKKDISSLYMNFHPYPDKNPRLVLVSHNNVSSDKIYLPDNIEKLPDDLMKYYGFDSE